MLKNRKALIVYGGWFAAWGIRFMIRSLLEMIRIHWSVSLEIPACRSWIVIATSTWQRSRPTKTTNARGIPRPFFRRARVPTNGLACCATVQGSSRHAYRRGWIVAVFTHPYSMASIGVK
jgi:hypothetical protein